MWIIIKIIIYNLYNLSIFYYSNVKGLRKCQREEFEHGA